MLFKGICAIIALSIKTINFIKIFLNVIVMDLNGKKILVTGGNSFLGKSLLPLLKKRCAEIISFGSKDYNLKEQDEVRKLFDESNPEIVIHMAADNGGIIYTKENPGNIFYNNLIINTLVQEESRIRGIEKFVGIGSVSSYPKLAKSPLKEETLWEGYPEDIHGPYGLAKRIMLTQSQAYREQYGFNALHLMPVNLYGPSYSLDSKSIRIIPILIRDILKAKKENKKVLELTGTKDASREFIYAEDCAEGIIKATELYNKPYPINLGTGKTIKIGELADKIKSIIKYEGKLSWKTTYSDTQPERFSDISKARKEFGFEAKTSLDDGLRKTIEWYLKNYKNL
jgi:GDP-L-fucose synthase